MIDPQSLEAVCFRALLFLFVLFRHQWTEYSMYLCLKLHVRFLTQKL